MLRPMKKGDALSLHARPIAEVMQELQAAVAGYRQGTVEEID
jgi:hypothetical protein